MKYLVLLTTIIFSINSVLAQIEKHKIIEQYTFNDKTVVIDSAGKVYPNNVWQLYLLSKDYTLRRYKNDSTDTLYLVSIYQKDNKEKSRRDTVIQSKFFRVGENISNFKATDIYGDSYNLKKLKGKVVVLNFWFIACQPCRKEMPELNEIVQKYKDSTNVVFLAIATDDRESVVDFLKTHPFYYNVVDGGRYIANNYGINSYPTNVVIDKEGKVAFHAMGYTNATPKAIDKAIQEALKN